MRVVSTPHEMLDSSVYVDLERVVGHRLNLKCEGFNFAGSVKLRTAAGLIAAAERDGRLWPGSVLIESSSGNLGLALGVIAASKGIPFVCVTDTRCNPTTLSLMRAAGADVVMVPDPEHGEALLERRLAYVRKRCADDPRYVWLNQYANDANWLAHYETTAREIVRHFPDIDVLFVGAGTCGTLMGCARYLRDIGSAVWVVAVDAVGSVTFGAPAARRMIPGLGTSVRPPLLDDSLVEDVVHVAEDDTIRCCRALARRGLLFGGSTGTVVSGAVSWLDRRDPGGLLTAVAVSPDLADRYAHTVYDDEWVRSFIGPGALEPSTFPSAQLVDKNMSYELVREP